MACVVPPVHAPLSGLPAHVGDVARPDESSAWASPPLTASVRPVELEAWQVAKTTSRTGSRKRSSGSASSNGFQKNWANLLRLDQAAP